MIDAWPHQRRGVELIAQREAVLLWWGMRSGKTKTIIEYVRGHRPMSTLVLAPKRVLPVWPGQLETHAPDAGIEMVCFSDLKGTVNRRMVEAAKLMRRAADNGQPCIVVCNYDSIWRTEAMLRPWDLVVCDESHRIKSPGAKQSRFCDRLRRYSRKRVCMTGTPMSQSILDAYGQFRFLDPSIYGASYTRFKNRYATWKALPSDPRVKVPDAYINLDEFYGRFWSLADRVKTEDVVKMPGANPDVPMTVKLEEKTMRAYRKMKDEFIVQLESGAIVNAANAAVKVGKLQQIAGGVVKDEDDLPARVGTEKREALRTLLEDMPPGEPVVVFCWFRSSIDDAREAARLAGRRVYELSGRQDDIGGSWRPEPGGVAVTQMQAGGAGVDMSAAPWCVFFDQCYRVELVDQCRARVRGVNQTRAVTYYHLLAGGTVDWKIRRAVAQRRDFIRDVLERRHTDDGDTAGGSEEFGGREQDAGAPGVRATGEAQTRA